MRVLFTGASSFTGYWFAEELARAGHRVAVTFRGAPDDYEGVRLRRVRGLADSCDAHFHCAFGTPAFFDLVRSDRWDMLCHHAAQVGDYRSPDFDVVGALAANTLNLAQVLSELAAGGCTRMIATGSVFEGGEGAGSDGLPAFSAYGLSKELTGKVIEFHALRAGIRLGKFVIPNPFGPLEEPRFTAYLMRRWAAGDVAEVRTPEYVRDNIHVSLLARAYVAFVNQLDDSPGQSRLLPSGYIESQGRFAERFAAEMRTRLGLACRLELARQTEFSEPAIRVNTDRLDGVGLGWDERAAWDELASYYSQELGLDLRESAYG